MEEKFTHGLVVIDPNKPDEIIHFVGFWSVPTQKDIDDLKQEFKTDTTFELMDIIDDLEIKPAENDLIEYMNDVVYGEPSKDNIQQKWDLLDFEQQQQYKHLLPTISIKLLPSNLEFKIDDIVSNEDGIMYLIIE